MNGIFLDDLNDDILLKIFDELELGELLKLAGMNYRFRELISHYQITPKYHLNDEFVRIHPVWPLSTIQNIELKEETELKFLRIFGNVISLLEIDYKDGYGYMVDIEWRQRTRSYINKYCSESLKGLKVHNSRQEMFSEWAKPFNNVTEVFFA